MIPAPPNSRPPMRLGIDVGGTKTAAVAIDGTGTVVHEVQLPTKLGEDGVLATICAAVEGIETAARLGAAVTSG